VVRQDRTPAAHSAAATVWPGAATTGLPSNRKVNAGAPGTRVQLTPQTVTPVSASRLIK
jgi:hypothetical protein